MTTRRGPLVPLSDLPLSEADLHRQIAAARTRLANSAGLHRKLRNFAEGIHRSDLLALESQLASLQHPLPPPSHRTLFR